MRVENLIAGRKYYDKLEEKYCIYVEEHDLKVLTSYVFKTMCGHEFLLLKEDIEELLEDTETYLSL